MQQKPSTNLFMTLQGKTAIITGGSQGIGRGIARTFAAKGARVVIAARDAKIGNAFVDELSQSGTDAMFVATDVSRRADVQELASKTLERFGRIDILVCNAGAFWEQSLETMSEDDWDRIQGINLKGTFLGVQAVLPAMKSQKSGRVLLTSSITGPITGMSGFAHYGATKAGQNGFMRSAALELAPHNITINSVMPGNILTEGLADLGEEYLAKMSAAIPMGRLGTPEDIGAAMAFFASDEARWITGQTLIVDGGQTLPEG